MVVSFTVSRVGKRYRPNSYSYLQKNQKNNKNDNSSTDAALLPQKQIDGKASIQDHRAVEADKKADHGNGTSNSTTHTIDEDVEVSVLLNLFPNGFSVGKNFQNRLLPYDRSAEELFTAIENGRLPGDMFDDIPGCKYYNGTLFCEVRDYRHCSNSREGITFSTQKSPIVHKVPLKMSMENVVKDLSSMSAASWTYRDHLEAESHILKTLHPNLNLNPEPQLDSIYRAPVTKKVDLGITWSWKKRKLNEAPVVDLVNRGLPTSQGLAISNMHKFSSQSNFLNHAEGVPRVRQAGTDLSPNLTRRSVATDSMPSCSPSTVVTNSRLADNCSKTMVNSLLTYIPISTSQKESPVVDPGTPSSSVLGKRDRSGAPDSTIIHNAEMKEKVGHSVGRQVGTAKKMSSLPSKNNQTAEKTGDDLHGRSHLENSRAVNNIQGPVCEGKPGIHIDIPICAQHEPDQASNFRSRDQGLGADRCFLMQTGNFHSLPRQSQSQQPSPLQRAKKHKTASTLSLQSNVPPPTKKKQQRKMVKENKNVSSGSQVFSPQGTPHSSHTVLPAEPPRSEIPINNARPKSVSLGILNSFVEPGNLNEGSRSSSSTGDNSANRNMINPYLAHPAETTADPILLRLSKIISVRKRPQLNKKERKTDQVLQNKSFPLPNPQIAFLLLDSGDSGKSKDNSKDGQLLSRSFVDKKVNVAKTRTLLFVHFPGVLSGNANPTENCGAQVKLVMSEKLDEDLVEAKVLYLYKEEIDTNASYTLPTFSSSQAADQFASQFKSLMLCEGYRLESDKLKTIPLYKNDGLSSQEPLPDTNTSLAAARNDQSLEASIPRLLPDMSDPMSNSRSTFDRRHLQGQSASNGAGNLSFKDAQSALLISSSNQSKLQNGTAEANTSYQQAQFPQNLGGNMKMDCAVGFESSSNLEVMPSSVSGYIPDMHCVGLSNNLPNNIPVLGTSYPLHHATSGFKPEDLAKLKQSDDVRRALTRGYSHPGFFSSGMLMDMPNMLNMPSNFSNLQQQQFPVYQQSPRLFQQGMLPPSMRAHLARLGHQHSNQVSFQQTNQRPQMSSLQPQIASVAQHTNTGNNVLPSEILGMNSGNQMHVGSDTIRSSSMTRSGVGTDVRTMKPRRPV